MNDKKQIVLELHHDSLSHAADSDHELSGGVANGRVDGTKQKRLGDARSLESLTKHS
jgi:hypothetical protein